MTLEQSRINRTVDEKKILAPDVQNQKVRYRPESRTWFPLKAIWISEEELQVALNLEEIKPGLHKLLSRKSEIGREHRLLIHPESEKFYAKLMSGRDVDSTTFRATSTASSRTVLVEAQGGQKFFAKLSLDVELGGVTRTVPSTEVVRSVGTDAYLRSLQIRAGDAPFTHIAEPMGISPIGWSRGGMIIRTIPDEILENKVKYVPLFSLYAPDTNGRSLLQDLAEKMKLTPEVFVKLHILEPFYKGWVNWGIDGVVTMEAHAQNVLLELNSDGFPTGRFVHRDLGGFNIDISKISAKEKAKLPVFSNLSEDYHQGFVDKARHQSISTYFEGGFLFNVDEELRRVQPSYVKGQVFVDGRNILAIQLNADSAAHVLPTELIDGPGVLNAVKRVAKSLKCHIAFARFRVAGAQ